MATILVVDDVSTNREPLVTLLRAQGHRLLEAADGHQAWALVRAEHPDLVITDVLMPVMDGYELAKRIQGDPATSQIPVVFYTASYGEWEARALRDSAGACDVLTKPPEPAEVLRVVGRALATGTVTTPVAALPALASTLHREHLRLLTDTLAEATGDLRAANARLRAVINIGLELASERDTDRLLQKVCVATRDLFGATYVTLGILDLSDRTVRRVVSCGTDSPGWISTGDPLSGLFQTVVAERRVLRGDNPTGDPALVRLPVSHPRVQSFLAAPLASPAQVYGWICFVGNEGRAFTEEDEHLVTALSGQIGRIYETSYFRELAEQRTVDLEDERDRAQRYLDTAEVMLVALDKEGRITLANRYACSVLGWAQDELLGRSWIDTCLPARLREEWQGKLVTVIDGRLPVAENPVLTKSGEERLTEWRNTVLKDDQGVVVGTLSSGTDVTARRALEAQFQQAQKMEAIGQLASGVAHDFNNLLTVILGFSDLLLADIDVADPHRADIGEIHLAAERAETLTRQLLAFSRKQIIEPTLVDLNLVVTGMREMLGRLIGAQVHITLTLQPQLHGITADRGQIEQIIMNLAVNARDAMPGGGTLTIETADVALGEHDSATPFGSLEPGDYVRLRLADTGAGMTPQVQAHLFEPFFTTKGAGKGTGLGLATVHGIATRCGARIAVDSVVGCGTAFTLDFPRAASVAGSVESQSLEHRATRARTPTVLVVDDDQGIRVLALRWLRRLGYTVLTAASAEEAFQVFERHPSIDVVLTDVVMPGASGPELTRQLVEQRPVVRVVYMSGYAEGTIAHHGVLRPGIVFLHKPFTAETLGQKIGEVLDR